MWKSGRLSYGPDTQILKDAMARMLNDYLMHRDSLVDYAASVVGSRASAEEVVQEAYFRIARMENRERLRHARGEASQVLHPVSYIYRIVRNLAVDCTRRMSVEGQHCSVDEKLELIPSKECSPEHSFRYKQELNIVASALDELPERTQIAFEMHRLGGYTMNEIAVELGVSTTLVHQMISRALTHCNDRLEQASA